MHLKDPNKYSSMKTTACALLVALSEAIRFDRDFADLIS